jgi:hypothetical protein
VKQAHAYHYGCHNDVPGYYACTWHGADNVCLGANLLTLYTCDNTQDGYHAYSRINGVEWQKDSYGNGCSMSSVAGMHGTFNVCRDDGSGCGAPCNF